MTLELIIFITSIIFGILLYWRESKSNKIYKFINRLMYSKELQMQPYSQKGFIYEQTFLMRLVYIALLFIVAILISKFFLPIEIATLQLFASSVVGTLIGTYLAGFLIKTTATIEAQSDNFEDVMQSTLEKGKEMFTDLKNKDTKAVEIAKKEIKEEPLEEKKSARERLKDKGLM